MFGSLGIGEIMVIGAVVVLIFGGKKFAELGKGVGDGIRGFKKALRDDDEQNEK